MAVDFSKFKKKAEKKLPILFLVEENSEGQVSRGLVTNILNACQCKKIHTELMLFSYGLEEWTLKFPKLNNNAPYFADLEGIKLDDIWRIIGEIEPSKQTFLGSALDVSKDILDDPDTTKPGRYKPVVIIIASKLPTQGWDGSFYDLLNNGRSSNAQIYWLYKNTCFAFTKALDPLSSSDYITYVTYNTESPKIRKIESNKPIKRFEKVNLNNIGSNFLGDLAQEIVSSFKLEPLEEVPAEDPVEFTTPGFDGEFGDGTDAKGDGVV